MLLCQTLPVLSVVISTLNSVTATITLTSSSVVGQACPGEVVTYTCMVDQAATVGWTAAPVLTDPTAVQFVATAPSDQTTRDCSATSSIQCAELDFYANFTNISAIQSGIADLNSTFRFTARAGLNGTVVQCMAATESGAPRANQSLIVAGIPSPPRTLSSTVQQYGQDSVTLTVQWQPPQYDGGAPVNYTITVGPGVGTILTSGTSVPVTVPYNVIHTVSIVATNCNGSSSAAVLTIPNIINCSDSTVPGNGSIDPYENTTEGAEIFFRCNPGFVPLGRMRAVCGTDGRWHPDHATLVCTFSLIDCRDPTLASGVIGEYNTTTVNSVIIYHCQQPGLTPSVPSSVCGEDERWSPAPSQVVCRMTTSLPTGTPTETIPNGTTLPTGSSDAPRASCSTSNVIAVVVSCAVSFIIATLVGAVVHYCTVRKKCDCQKFYSLTIARKQQHQQPAPVYEDIVGQSQNIELKENVAYGPVQQ